jgi:hypothetical protein
MNTNIITPPIWLQLSNEERLAMRKILDIPRTGGSVVEDDKVISDGCTQNDLNVITITSLQRLMDSEDTDFFSLWGEAIKNVQAMLKEEGEKLKKITEAQMIVQEEQNAEISAGIMLNSIKRLPMIVQLIIHRELDSILFPKITTQTNEQTKGEGNISATTSIKKGSKPTKVTSQE